MGVMYQSYSNVGPRILSTIISMPSETCNIEKSRGHLERTSCQRGGEHGGLVPHDQQCWRMHTKYDEREG